jgi:phage gp45-like
MKRTLLLLTALLSLGLTSCKGHVEGNITTDIAADSTAVDTTKVDTATLDTTAVKTDTIKK